MDLKTLVMLKAASGQGDGNLLKITTANAVRFDDGYDNFTESGGVCYITGTSRGGYGATIRTNTQYTFSFETDGPDSGLALRVWKEPTDSSCGTMIVNDSEHRSVDFSISDDADKDIEIVCGFYCTPDFAQNNPKIYNWRLVLKT